VSDFYLETVPDHVQYDVSHMTMNTKADCPVAMPSDRSATNTCRLTVEGLSGGIGHKAGLS
jgi:hypothetical protein